MDRLRRSLIITADDFGVSESVNEAVQQAHEAGVLQASSLMVGGAAWRDAVQRARRLPRLRVGLHVVLLDGAPVLPPDSVPDLVGRDGRFNDGMFASAVRFMVLPSARAQLAAEIRAQFERFAATGLALDHANAHKHFHLHPLILQMILRIGRDFGLRAVRLPSEPLSPGTLLLRPWVSLMRRYLDEAGVLHNDHVFGITHSGGIDEATLIAILQRLPEGTTEIYLHPAVSCGEATPAPHARSADELAALLSPRVRAAVDATGAACGGYSDVVTHERSAAPESCETDIYAHTRGAKSKHAAPQGCSPARACRPESPHPVGAKHAVEPGAGPPLRNHSAPRCEGAEHSPALPPDSYPRK
jgi:chitin disaccharide deacetylase